MNARLPDKPWLLLIVMLVTCTAQGAEPRMAAFIENNAAPHPNSTLINELYQHFGDMRYRNHWQVTRLPRSNPLASAFTVTDQHHVVMLSPSSPVSDSQPTLFDLHLLLALPLSDFNGELEGIHLPYLLSFDMGEDAIQYLNCTRARIKAEICGPVLPTKQGASLQIGNHLSWPLRFRQLTSQQMALFRRAHNVAITLGYRTTDGNEAQMHIVIPLAGSGKATDTAARLSQHVPRSSLRFSTTTQ